MVAGGGGRDGQTNTRAGVCSSAELTALDAAADCFHQVGVVEMMLADFVAQLPRHALDRLGGRLDDQDAGAGRPVNASCRRRVGRQRRADAGAVAIDRLKTPAGTPASSMISATISAFSGVYSLGFSTMVQPAAMRRDLHMIWLIGQFQA